MTTTQSHESEVMDQEINQLIDIAESCLVAIRKKPIQYQIIKLKMMGIGFVRLGVEINGTKMWHFRKGQIIRNNTMQSHGVLIQYADGTVRWKFNKFYCDINTDLL